MMIRFFDALPTSHHHPRAAATTLPVINSHTVTCYYKVDLKYSFYRFLLYQPKHISRLRIHLSFVIRFFDVDITAAPNCCCSIAAI